MSWLVAIDTSTALAGVALTDGEQLAETTWPAGQRHTTTLLPALVELAGRVDVSLDAIEAVAVATGPGSFSGLRVGMATAKGFALAHELPIVGVPTLLATASPFLFPELQVIPVIAAGRRRYVWAVYGVEGGQPLELVPPVNGLSSELEEAVAALGERVVVCGEAPQGVSESAVSGFARRAVSRVAAVAGIGWRRWIAGEADDPVRLEPIYLHLATARGPVQDAAPSGRS